MRRSRSWITMREFWSWKRANEGIKPCREYKRCVATCASSHLFDHVSDFPLLAFQHVVQMVDLLLENGNLLLQLLCPEQRHTRNWRWVRRHGWFCSYYKFALLLHQIYLRTHPQKFLDPFKVLTSKQGLLSTPTNDPWATPEYVPNTQRLIIVIQKSLFHVF